MIDEAGIDCHLEIDGGVKVNNIREGRLSLVSCLLHHAVLASF
jgi:pentose-5-phosphate-3-epimerase